MLSRETLLEGFPSAWINARHWLDDLQIVVTLGFLWSHQLDCFPTSLFPCKQERTKLTKSALEEKKKQEEERRAAEEARRQREAEREARRQRRLEREERRRERLEREARGEVDDRLTNEASSSDSESEVCVQAFLLWHFAALVCTLSHTGPLFPNALAIYPMLAFPTCRKGL